MEYLLIAYLEHAEPKIGPAFPTQAACMATLKTMQEDAGFKCAPHWKACGTHNGKSWCTEYTGLGNRD